MSEFDKVIGYDSIKLEMMRFCDVLKSPQKYAKLGVTMPGGILLCGDPGLGKTMLSECFILEAGCRSFTLKKDKPDGDFVNEIKATYEKAKIENQAIVFLDDLDKYANEDQGHCDAEEYITVQSCIDECKGYGVFTIATANEWWRLPESLIRAGRFDKMIEIKQPTGIEAQRIIEHFLNSKEIRKDIDVEEITRFMEGHSCAELEAVINEAGILAGFDNREQVEQRDIIRACLRRIYDSPESMDASGPEMIRRVAVHEAGHAVVAEMLEPGCVNFVSISGCYGKYGGITKYRYSDTSDYLITDREDEVIGSLGGKAATETVFGEADMECGADIRSAFRMVSKLVDDKCAYGFETYMGMNLLIIFCF